MYEYRIIPYRGCSGTLSERNKMKKTAKKKPVKTKKNVPRILLLYDLEPEVIIPPKPSISASEIRWCLDFRN